MPRDLTFVRTLQRIGIGDLFSLQYQPEYNQLVLTCKPSLIIKSNEHIVVASGQRIAPQPSKVFGVWLNPRLDENNNPIMETPKPIYVPYSKRQSTQNLMAKRKRNLCSCCKGH